MGLKTLSVLLALSTHVILVGLSIGSISTDAFRLVFIGCLVGYAFGHLVNHRYIGLLLSWGVFAVPNASSFGPEQEYSAMMGVIGAGMFLMVIIPVIETTRLLWGEFVRRSHV